MPDAISSIERGAAALDALIAAGSNKPSPTAERSPQAGTTHQQIDSFPSGKTTEQAVSHLAALPRLEYERMRASEAERLGVRVTVLDAEVRKARPRTGDDEPGNEVMFPPLDPWPTPVNGAELLDELAKTVRTFVVLPEHTDRAIALWITFTYLTDTVNVAPILALTSPEKRCGKTSALGVLNELVARPLSASSITAPALFRSIEKWAPTLLIDEADTFIRESDELRGVINSGHTRASAFVIRTVGDDHEPRRFATWGAKVIALIGRLPDTLADRAIAIELRRKLPSERVQKLRHTRDGSLADLARKLVRWTADNRGKIGAARPAIPETLHDRAADNWEPLLAIAELAGGQWPQISREAAEVLSGSSPDGDSLKVELLKDIRRAFANGDTAVPCEGGRFKADRLTTDQLLDLLNSNRERPWFEFSKGKPITPRKLARMVAPFGVVPNTIRDGETTFKGYLAKWFEDAFSRYLAPSEPSAAVSEPSHRHKPASMRVVTDQQGVTEDGALRIDNPSQASIHAGCDGVTDEKAAFGISARVERF
jgi:putative DNA primase/helicase